MLQICRSADLIIDAQNCVSVLLEYMCCAFTMNSLPTQASSRGRGGQSLIHSATVTALRNQNKTKDAPHISLQIFILSPHDLVHPCSHFDNHQSSSQLQKALSSLSTQYHFTRTASSSKSHRSCLCLLNVAADASLHHGLHGRD